jgi:uncharacterized membrane protein
MAWEAILRSKTPKRMSQKEINNAEWQNPDNWGGPRWISVYFSKKDTRTWVPKQTPWMGATLNLAKTSGVIQFLVILITLCLLPLLSLVLVLSD